MKKSGVTSSCGGTHITFTCFIGKGDECGESAKMRTIWVYIYIYIYIYKTKY